MQVQQLGQTTLQQGKIPSQVSDSDPKVLPIPPQLSDIGVRLVVRMVTTYFKRHLTTPLQQGSDLIIKIRASSIAF